MANSETNVLNPARPLRLWPGVLTVILQWIAWFVLPRLSPDLTMVGVIGGVVAGLVILIWWLFFSRASRIERFGAIALMVLTLIVTSRLVHKSIAGGMMGMMLYMYAIPILSFVLVAWAVATRRLSSGPRRAFLLLAVALGCGVFTLVRTGGITGDANSDLHWRWTQTPEERLLAMANDEPAARPATPDGAPAGSPTPAAVTPSPLAVVSPTVTPVGATPTPNSEVKPNGTPDASVAVVKSSIQTAWPGFRGAARDGVIKNGVRIDTDWAQHAPVNVWRRPIGPGWSSFAVRGDLAYTQEQRGNDEVVSCYDLKTGEPVWRHKNAARFWESNGGAGPRGTPTLSGSRVYSFGATGILNALDARNGAVAWSRNAASDTQTKLPGWGFSSSPLVVGDVVIVAAAGALAAYDTATGTPKWYGPTGGWGYSSPQLVTIDGVAQVLFMNGEGAISVAPADGKLLWKHAWPCDSIVQPAVIAAGDVLIGSGSGLGQASAIGMRRLAVSQNAEGWTVAERWTSNGLKPYFNDFVVSKGHAFGFDGSILACIDLKDGKRKWKGGRYGHGQIIALPDQDLLLVLSEEGELALVAASPDQFTEIAKIPAIEGKTWNHPVLVGDLLLIRNDQEMAAFKLALASR